LKAEMTSQGHRKAEEIFEGHKRATKADTSFQKEAIEASARSGI
jgi:hypothetical protein